MAYTITQLVNEYNSLDAVMLSNTLIKNHGIIQRGTYALANKQLAHTYTSYATGVDAGIRTINDGVGTASIVGTTATKNLSLYATKVEQVDKAYIGNFDDFYNIHAPIHFNGIANQIEKSIIYGTISVFGNTAYTGTGWFEYCVNNGTQTQLQTTGSATGCTSMYAVRFAPAENMDGALIVVDPYAEAGFVNINPDWNALTWLAGTTGPYQGYAFNALANGLCLLPGTNNVASINGIKTGTLPTEAQIDQMLDNVRADQNTVIFVNLMGKGILNRLGKSGALIMTPDEMGYNNMIATWNGVPIIVTDNISTSQTGLLYGLS